MSEHDDRVPPEPEQEYESLPADDSAAPLMGQDEQRVKEEGRKGDRTAEAAALISALVFLVSSWITVLSNQPGKLGWFALHPIFQSLAIALFTYGVLTLQPTSQPRTKAAGLARHQLVIAGLGFPSIIIGTLAMIWNKQVHDAPHFTTWHGIFGITAFAWIILQVALGGGSVWFDGAAFGGGAKAKALWKYHRLSGYVLFAFLLLTAHVAGAWSTWMIISTAYATRLVAYTIAPLVILVALYSRVRTSKMKFF
ncbi:hypothetical protein PLICRDRAFT_41950 [Plicaturopsis crispa FD-325 SS-3]|nr:hypothetical protein PLICRDRAFT_41950 [Plicaturopsis crispa FD-325 SS-3]